MKFDSTRRPQKWLRVFIPAILILVWFIGAGVGGPYFGKVSEVSSNDPTSYLPTSADATTVQKLLGDFRDGNSIPAVLIFTSDYELDDTTMAALQSQLDNIVKINGVDSGTSPLIASKDAHAAQAFVPIDSSSDIGSVVDTIRDALAKNLPLGIEAYVTGPAGFSADLVDAFSGIDGLLLLVALIAVFVILVLVYRSILLPVAVLSTSLFALCVALLTVWWLAKAGILLLSGQTQGILFILVIGAATDYALLYTARYREELRMNQHKWDATMAALKGSFEPIIASGSTVIAGLLCLLLSDLKSNSTLGPVAAIGIVFAMLSALSLLPAILLSFGRSAFWPKRPHYEPDTARAEEGMNTIGIWAWLGHQIRRRPRVIWTTTTIALLIGAFGLTQLQATGVAQSELVLGQSQARDGQVALGKHFPGGSGSPTYVVTQLDMLQESADILLSTAGVESVMITTSDSPSGTAPVTKEGITAFGAPGTPTPEATVVNGQVLLQATLTAASDSAAAEQTVRELRSNLAGIGIVGGVTATAIDTNDASIHDRNLIIPVVLIVILLILMLLLRSILAPVLLILTTVISFGTALGISAIIFNGVFQFPGADAAVPLFGFVFLVALGIDYNIFLMTRVREESLTHGTRDGVLRGLSSTGGVITSAGLVLAATFAALSVIPILFLLQLAFIVAFGVLLDTFIVRSLLVPALVYDIGPAVWWPSKLSKRSELSREEALSLREPSRKPNHSTREEIS
ncbi:MAG: efflux RND transporter permease subunit [Microbacteriaceae bacterium]